MIDDWLKSLGFWAFPAFVGLYAVLSVLGIPNIILMLLAGTLFGLPIGVLLVSIADTIGAAACYGVGRTIARQRIKRWMAKNPNFAQLDHAVAEKGWKIILFSRLSPIIPSNILNYGFSCTKINFWQYLFFTWLGMLPIIGLYVYLGYFGMNMMGSSREAGSIALQTGGLVATIAVAVYTTRLAKSALSPTENQQKNEQ
ncbi:MAG: hypothetical protein Kow00121_53260 [Elainellaceae cyanobacterium]